MQSLKKDPHHYMKYASVDLIIGDNWIPANAIYCVTDSGDLLKINEEVVVQMDGITYYLRNREIRREFRPTIEWSYQKTPGEDRVLI
jgi:hypothetical protein